MVTVKITPEESMLVEKSFYQYNASLDIIAHLSKQVGINQEYLKEYIKNSEEYYHEMEKNKAQVGNKYKPKDRTDYGYRFNFDACEINYYTPEENVL